MSEIANAEQLKPNEARISSPYIRAILDPDQKTFDGLLNQSAKTILDIGCGARPRLSFELQASDLWIGCDPEISEKGPSILVHKGETTVDTSSKLIVFSSSVEDIPNIKPDILISVAPNPQDICEKKVFNIDLVKLLDPRKKQYFIIALDHRTIEASGYGKEAKYKVLSWLRGNDFNPLEKSKVMDRFEANSGDLEAENTPMIFVRNFK